MANTDLNQRLLKAASEGRYSELEGLIEEGASVDFIGAGGLCALQYMTSANRNLTVIPEGTNVNVNVMTNDYPSPLYHGIKKGNLKNVRWLLSRGADTNKVHTNNQSALDLVRVNNTDMIKLLVSFGADQWTKDKDEKRDAVLQDAITQASTKDNKITSVLEASVISGEKLQWLAEDDISVVNVDDVRIQLDILDSRGNSLLHLATAKAKMNNVTFLLEKSPLVNLQNQDGDSCLHVAVRMNHTAMVKLLLTNGADVKLTNKKKETPLHLCHFNSSLLKCLIVNNSDTEATTREGDTALMIAVRWEDEENIRLLLEHNPGINAQNKAGDTALHLSVSRGVGLVRLLLRDNPDVKLKNSLGQTALHCAASRLHVEIVEVLLTSGADPNTKNNKKETPLDVAMSMSVIQALVLRGATQWNNKKTRKDQTIEKLIKEKKPAVAAAAAAGEDPTPESYKCKICYEFPVDTLLKPCHHLCVCSHCAAKVHTCPICRETPDAKVRLHIP